MSHSSSIDDVEAAYAPILESGIDAAQTIVQCSQHMKCIVDGWSPFSTSVQCRLTVCRCVDNVQIGFRPPRHDTRRRTA